jgi:ferredoxin
MTHVVTEACKGCKDTSCVEVCPVDCFYEGEDMVIIDPHECIDCGVCIPECPVDAIFLESPDLIDWVEYANKNLSSFPNITKKINP